MTKKQEKNELSTEGSYHHQSYRKNKSKNASRLPRTSSTKRFAAKAMRSCIGPRPRWRGRLSLLGLAMGFSFIAEALLASHSCLTILGASSDIPPRIQRWISDRGPRASTVVYGEHAHSRSAIAAPQGIGTIFVRVARLWSVVLCANLGGTLSIRSLRRARCVSSMRPVRQTLMDIGVGHLGSSFWNRVRARHFRRMVDRADGLASAWRGVRPRQHRYHHHLSDRPRRLQPHHRRLHHHVLLGAS